MFNKYSYVLSLENLQGDWEPRSDPLSDLISELDEKNFEETTLSKFQGLEKDVISLILEGYNLYQISQFLCLSTNQIYKIRRKILKVLAPHFNKEPKVPKKKIYFYESLIWLYHLRYPEKKKEEIYQNWEKDPILKEYKKPKYNIYDALYKKVVNNQYG